MDKFHRFKSNCTLPDTVPVGFVNAPNIRATMQIIWSCFSVILLCTWSILRPNVPPELKPKEPRPADPIYKKLFPLQKIYKMLFLLYRKAYWAGVMLIAPEFLTTFTTKKMLGTKENNAMLKALAGSEIEWDLQQTILADMGGIVIDFSNIESQSVNNEKYRLEKPSGDIESDPLCPGGDFITQFERRQSQWFGGCGILWKRHEPHVRIAIKLAVAIEYSIITNLLDIKIVEINNKNKLDALVKVLALCARVYYRHPFAQLELGTVAFSVTAIILYIVEWDKPKDINTPVYVKAAVSSVSEKAFESIVKAAPFPYMQFPLVQYKHYYMPISLVVAMITVVTFGEIHLLAWNLQFITPVEGLLWKISAIVTIACPVLYCSSHLPWLGKNPKKATKIERFLIKAVIGFANFFYFFARLFLITESIRSLYYLPRGACIATWAAEFPHLC
ncbi:hypothetical protein V8C37DRAFT_412516 [Trichoderma ceciliae]